MTTESTTQSIGFFEKYLTLWVLLCIGIGIMFGYLPGDSIKILSTQQLVASIVVFVGVPLTAGSSN